MEAGAAVRPLVQLRVLGGAIDRVPAHATAYAHRGARILALVAAFYDAPHELPSRREWVDATASRLGGSGAFVSFMGDEGPERVRAAYPGATWRRLAAIKARYDPENVFRLNQNVPPA
jgi:FAD/FMN-containing dehydrogenase